MDKKKVTNIEVKKKNRNAVFRYICKNGTVSNPDISYNLKLSLPTVTQITKELIEKELVEEKGELQSTGGRRAKALSVSENVRLAVGLDITRNHISLVLVNIRGEILKYERIYHPYGAGEEYYRQVNDRLECFLEQSGTDRGRILGVGISFPGIMNLEKKMVTYSHVLGVESVLFDDISCYFSYPCYFLNDANAGAYAEGIRTEGAERFFYLSLSDTVGGAFFCKNELMHGKNFRCGEVGHMTITADGERCYCGKRGCLDAYCSARILADAADGKLDRFFTLLRHGDEKILKIWDDYTSYLAMAVNNLHMVLDCDVVLGGYVGSYADMYIQELWDKVSARNTFGEKEPYVKGCCYKVEAAALGAALQLIEEFIKEI